MTDVSHYSGLKARAAQVYKTLVTIRKEIKVFEQQMILEFQRTQAPLNVVADNRPAVIRIQDRTRRLPLTEKDLREKLLSCLLIQFDGKVHKTSIEQFSVEISKKIWSERRTTQDHRISLKISA
jgi:hypothetical protein